MVSCVQNKPCVQDTSEDKILNEEDPTVAPVFLPKYPRYIFYYLLLYIYMTFIWMYKIYEINCYYIQFIYYINYVAGSNTSGCRSR